MWGALVLGSALAGPNFDYLEATQVGRTLYIDYERARGPLEGDPTVQLLVRSRGERFTMRASAAPRRGQWVFPRLPPQVTSVEMRCATGCAVRDQPLRGLSLFVRDGASSRRNRRPVEVRPPPPPPWASDRSVVQACDRAFASSRDELRCLEVANRFAFHPAAAIEACGRAFVGSVNEMTCIETAAGAPLNPSGAIEACGRAFTGSRDELMCVERAVVDPVMSPPVVEACGRAFVSGAGELACMDLGLTRPQAAPRVIETCDRSFVGESQQLQCIRSALPRR